MPAGYGAVADEEKADTYSINGVVEITSAVEYLGAIGTQEVCLSRTPVSRTR